MATTYNAINASLINSVRRLAAKDTALAGRIVDTPTGTFDRRISSRQRPHQPVPDVVNLKAQFGLDTDNDGTVDTWQSDRSLVRRELVTGRWRRCFRSARCALRRNAQRARRRMS
jgi:hypothetical protein